MSQIYVACLASYNNGVLHGAWIDATADADAMHEEVQHVLRKSRFPNVLYREHSCVACNHSWRTQTSQNACCEFAAVRCAECGLDHVLSEPAYTSAEEWAVHDIDDSDDVGLDELGETSDLAAIAARVEAAELATDELGEDGPAIVAAYWGNVGCRPPDASEAVEGAREQYCGEFDTLEAWAEEYADDTGMLSEVPESLRYYFDFAAWARDQDVFMVRVDGHGFVFLE